MLGTELQKHLNCMPLARWASLPSGKFDAIIHCAAYTDVSRAETDRVACYEANVLYTRHVAAHGLPLVYISTEYVFSGKHGLYMEHDFPHPVNFYGMTKYDGEIETRRAPSSLVIRGVHKRRPFKHSAAYANMYTSGDYVDVMGPMIASAILKWLARENGFVEHDTIHLGTGRKSVLDLAFRTNQNVQPAFLPADTVSLPYDASLNINRWEKMNGKN